MFDMPLVHREDKKREERRVHPQLVSGKCDMTKSLELYARDDLRRRDYASSAYTINVLPDFVKRFCYTEEEGASGHNSGAALAFGNVLH